MVIAIRREDKSIWERRAPLIPEDVKDIIQNLKLKVIVQASDIRIFSNKEYEEIGAIISENLEKADIILGVKEIPPEKIIPDKTYVFFAHVIKGQKHNMAMLKKLLELRCTLIDYERVIDENGRRLIFFGKYAGYAGLVETIHAFGKKLSLNNILTPFNKIKQPFEYSNIQEAKDSLRSVGEEISKNGIPDFLLPLTVGFAGYGNVSKGAQEFFEILPHLEVSPSDLISNYESLKKENKRLVKIVFKEIDTVQRFNGDFDLNEYFEKPHLYHSIFDEYIPKLKILLNCILWKENNPRLITKEYLKNNYRYIDKFFVIGDISCDINGAIEITHKATQPDMPCYTYYPDRDFFIDGVQKDGITNMAVDNLPCEFARESSIEFSHVLKNFIPQLIKNNFDKDFEQINLPYPLKKAIILHKGQLTKEYKYLEKYLGEEK